jgi:hypothetical protein
MTGPIADFVVSLRSDGRVVSQGSLSSALKLNKALSSEAEADQTEPELAGEMPDTGMPDAPTKTCSGKLIVAEEIAEGHVSWDAGKITYIRCLLPINE